jgi:hypothetical protein
MGARDEFDAVFEPLPPGLGLAPLKTEGAALPYDPGAGPGVPLTRWGRVQRRLGKLRERLRYLPHRLWWAAFGDEYY